MRTVKALVCDVLIFLFIVRAKPVVLTIFPNLIIF